MPVRTRVIDWQSEVVQANPNHYRDLNHTVEFEFTARPGDQNPRTHENGMRVFRGEYKRRGPYAP